MISTSGESPAEWLIVPEQSFGASWDAREDYEALFRKTTPMFLCPASGHVWIFWSGLGEPGVCYYPGSSDPLDTVSGQHPDKGVDRYGSARSETSVTDDQDMP